VFYDDVYSDRTHTWKKQSEFAFVLSPRGGGYDCHRTWEAILLGCIPIVKSSPMDPLYNNLPVLIIDDWSDIHEALLRNTVEEFSARQFQMEKLELSYWACEFDKMIQKSTRI
jgi:hypothetical protein